MPTACAGGSPGDKTLGLSPHMDAGTVERWIDPGYQKVYENVFAGDWRGYDPFDAHTPAGDARDSFARGVQHVPHLSGLDGADAARAEGRHAAPDPDRRGHLLRAPSRASGRRCGGRSLRGGAGPRARRQPEWHPDLMAGLVSIPEVMPGDTVWWHTDICHAVADEHAGKEYASVHLHRLGARLREEPRLSPEAEARVSGRAFAARLRGNGLRGRFQGPGDGEGSDRSRPRPNGFVTTPDVYCRAAVGCSRLACGCTGASVRARDHLIASNIMI